MRKVFLDALRQLLPTLGATGKLITSHDKKLLSDHVNCLNTVAGKGMHVDLTRECDDETLLRLPLPFLTPCSGPASPCSNGYRYLMISLNPGSGGDHHCTELRNAMSGGTWEDYADYYVDAVSGASGAFWDVLPHSHYANRIALMMGIEECGYSIFTEIRKKTGEQSAARVSVA